MRNHVILVLLLTGLVLAGCTSDPTASPEYAELEASVAALESDLSATEAELAAAEGDLEAANAAVSALETQVSELEGENAAANDRLASLETSLEEWKAFTGSPNDEPFVWSQEYFDTFVLTCSTTDSEDACICFAEGFEEQATLMDMLYFTELNAAAFANLVEVEPQTGLPLGTPPEIASLAGDVAFRCLFSTST
jgi:outer membrane murein-binding lipoprotein Lpp